MDVGAVREAIADNLEAGLDDMQVSAYILSNPTPPAAQVLPGEADHDQAMSRGHELRDFKVQVIVGLTTDVGAQKRLDALLSDDSVTEAILSDPTLGGAAEDINVERDTGYQTFAREGGAPLLGAEWTVNVYG